jgi:transcriptional regulator with XRE-family HTH domain
MSRPSSRAQAEAPAILTQATLRAAELLGLSKTDLSRILGVSEATVSRLGHGRSVDPDPKEGELALLFLRVYRNLDTLMGGDDANSQRWLHARNLHLEGIPSEIIQSITGLVRVAEYLDEMPGKL